MNTHLLYMLLQIANTTFAAIIFDKRVDGIRFENYFGVLESG